MVQKKNMHQTDMLSPKQKSILLEIREIANEILKASEKYTKLSLTCYHQKI